MLDLPKSVTVVEVAPRDGLQSFDRAVDTATKIAVTDRLSEAGFGVIEVTGFAHPRVIPNLADAEAVAHGITRRPHTVYRGLVPNARGAERAKSTPLDELVGLITVSETYLAKNQNMKRAEAVEEAIAAFRIAERAGKSFVMALGMSMWCPYEGVIPVESTLALLKQFRNAGMRSFYLAGSLGLEEPKQVYELFQAARRAFPDIELGYHVHNVSGHAPANILAAIAGGATFVEGAICGIGGGIMMPTTLGSVGNYPTEDLVALLEASGVTTGLDRDAVIDAARDVAALLAITPRSHAANGGTRSAVAEAALRNPRSHPA
ncbi:MAG TPA: hydroxymethylglutaryl-CoA lyase [Hyphomicrobiaceae bacterium]|nr:hydroxymethylglutaryl-CoA lyase [Hyphomicrobiaceae bacterium]